MSYTIHDVKQALSLPDFDAVLAQAKMMPEARPRQRPSKLKGKPRLGGVLALFYCQNDELHLVLTRRRDDLNSHAGQISFPGGRKEETETLLMTALRETEEEIGVAPSQVEVVGLLHSLYIPPSDFKVHPFVAWAIDGKRPSFTPNEDEVDEIIEVPLRVLMNPATRQAEPWDFQGHKITVPYYAVAGYKVWGATAMMLSELFERLRAFSAIS